MYGDETCISLVHEPNCSAIITVELTLIFVVQFDTQIHGAEHVQIDAYKSMHFNEHNGVLNANYCCLHFVYLT